MSYPCQLSLAIPTWVGTMSSVTVRATAERNGEFCAEQKGVGTTVMNALNRDVT